MAANRDRVICDTEKFQSCFRKLLLFRHRDNDESKTNLNVLIDELNSVDFLPRFVPDDHANQLLLKLASVIPFHLERIIIKLCQVVINLKIRQQVTLSDSCVKTLVDFMVKALHRCQPFTHADILRALSVILYENVDRVSEFHNAMVGQLGVLLQLTGEAVQDEEVLAGTIQCMENISFRSPNQRGLSDEHVTNCFGVFLRMLHHIPKVKMDPSMQCKILISCLRGLQNLLMTSKVDLTDQLGSLLAGIRAHMFHGLLAQPQSIPTSLYPMTTGDPNLNTGKPNQPGICVVSDGSCRGNGAKRAKKKNVVTKKDVRKDGVGRGEEEEIGADGHYEGCTEEGRRGGETSESLVQVWSRISSSDSEYSDTEGSQVACLRSARTRVRQCALSCFHTLVKNIDKKIMFGYWSSFIPTSAGNSPQNQTLFTCILKEPSPKCRMGALAALTALIDGTKPFLAVAEESGHTRKAFIPFSVTLGTMIKEIHRCLLQALVAENFSLTLTQLIKCLSTLVLNVTYQRLYPGLLTRIVKQIRHFLSHRDPNVRVACLTCLGSIVSIQPPLLEVCHIVQPPQPPLGTVCLPLPSLEELTLTPSAPVHYDDLHSFSSTDSGFCSSSYSYVGLAQSGTDLQKIDTPEFHEGLALSSGSGSSGLGTPALATSPGTQTPVFTDQVLQAYAKDTSWLIKLSIRNVIPQPSSASILENSASTKRELLPTILEPVPVRLESLQVLANLTKGYFPIIRNSVKLLQDLIQTCFEDKDPIVKLHGTKLLDELTQAMARDVSGIRDGMENTSLGQVLEFWLYLLSGPLQSLLQAQGYNPVRANACDCISNIGVEVFQQLPVDRRMLCITMVLGLTNEEDKLVKSAAVRTLGVYILYNCLRDDVSFVADSANAILNCMEDSSVNVRMKAAWSLANLCDALVLNRDNNDKEFMDDFSDMLLLKLLTTATKATGDSDKVKSNAVRAVGNVLRYLPERSLGKSVFNNAVSESVKALVKNVLSGTMKVRWNACYAIGNMFRNSLLPHGSALWAAEVFSALCSVVCDCKNFKVRINAALALSIPLQRQHYGSAKQFITIWDSLVNALKTSETIIDFAEYRYRDNLTEQICVAIFHLCSLLIVEDLEPLLHLLQTDGQMLQLYTAHYQSIKAGATTDLESAQANCLAAAQETLEALGSLELSSDQQLCLSLLAQVCLPLLDAENYEEMKPERTAFKQIYD